MRVHGSATLPADKGTSLLVTTKHPPTLTQARPSRRMEATAFLASGRNTSATRILPSTCPTRATYTSVELPFPSSIGNTLFAPRSIRNALLPTRISSPRWVTRTPRPGV
jgi:hypothetical protein